MSRARLLLIGSMFGLMALLAAGWIGGSNPASAAEPLMFRVTLTNLSDPPTPISPGVLVSHCQEGAFWSRGERASPGLELIAEVGNPGTAVAVEREDSLDGISFVQERRVIGEVGPGQSVTVDVEFAQGCVLSTAHMLVESNDSFVGVNSLDISSFFNGESDGLLEVELRAYDAGTEMNTEPGSGFEGGQPDPTRGAANLDNGVATDEPISSSLEWPGTQAMLRLELLESLQDADGIDTAVAAQDDSADEGAVGFPNGGTGGLAPDSRGTASALIFLLAVPVLFGLTGAAIGLRRLVRSRR